MVCDQAEKGLEYLEVAIRVSPGDPGAFFFYASATLAHLSCGRPAEALEFATRSTSIYDGWDTTYRVIASALAHLDRLDEAHTAVARLLALAPDCPIDSVTLVN